MMKNLVMALSMLLLTANVYAAKVISGNYSHYSSTTVINVTPVDTKDEAYAIGMQKLKDLKSKSASELSEVFRLNLTTSAEQKSVSLEDANITVQEMMTERGNIVYKGAINVTYHYSVNNDKFD